MQPKPCAICGQPMDYIRGGVSKKTGEAYNAFWACSDRTHKQPRSTTPQPVGEYTGNPRFADPSPPPSSSNAKPDWDAIAEGKVRHGFAIEAFKMKMDLTEELVQTIDGWTKYVMTGSLPESDYIDPPF